jgi:serine/threonine protein kinase
MLHFCNACGAANTEAAVICSACQGPLAKPEQEAPLAAVKIAPAPQLQVVDGTPVPVEPLRGGDFVAGRYRVVREVGQGGFGAVYLVRDMQKHGRLVALKRIDPGLLKPREIIEATDAFHREVTFLSALSHPRLPKIYDHFTDPDHWYLVMQYIEGQTLEERLKRSRKGYLPISQVLKIGMALTNVLGYLHRRRPPVIFRDLKPANIMLTRTGRVYLIDFGIARRFAPEKKRDTGPLGSPGYAAPEQYGTAQRMRVPTFMLWARPCRH